MSISTQDFNEIIKYPFQDKQWFSKLIVQGFVLFLLCFVFFIGIPFLTGFMVVCAQKALKKDPTLPGWDEWGTYWRLGWKALAVNLVYALPIIIPSMFMVIGVIAFTLFAESQTQNDPLLAGGFTLGIGLFFLFYAFLMIYFLALYIIQPIYMGIIAAGGTVRDGLSLKSKIWPFLKVNVGSTLICLGIVYLVGMVSSMGMLILFIGYFFTYPYALAVSGYSYGVLYRNSSVKPV